MNYVQYDTSLKQAPHYTILGVRCITIDLPQYIQSDQGSKFMSGLFQQVMDKLGIKQYRSSAYHPERQGALERFHQTLKNMIRSYCFDTKILG